VLLKNCGHARAPKLIFKPEYKKAALLGLFAHVRPPQSYCAESPFVASDTTNKKDGRGSMRLLAFGVRAICGVNTLIGHVFSWLSLGIVVVCFTVVVQRYVFATSYVWMQDLYIWLNGAMFTAVAGFALMRNDHVRVDIFYRPAKPETKAIVDLVGCVLFLLPFCAVVYVYSMPFVTRAWSFAEGSANVGGMPGLYILKSFIILFVGLLALQGIAMIFTSILVLSGRSDLVPASQRYGNVTNLPDDEGVV
jgi:TRAP-type mannitol/chloroaromatic compound transport system permease small subunit